MDKPQRDVEMEHFRQARELQNRFDYYFVGLIFTLLAASVQTVRWSDNNLSTTIELMGWAFLASAGIFGLRRMEESSRFYYYAADLSRESEARNALFSSKVFVPPGLLNEAGAKVQELEKRLKMIQDSTYRDSRVSRFCFVFGFVAVLVRRAIEGVFG